MVNLVSFCKLLPDASSTKESELLPPRGLTGPRPVMCSGLDKTMSLLVSSVGLKIAINGAQCRIMQNCRYVDFPA
jgi:hypothetical protein